MPWFSKAFMFVIYILDFMLKWVKTNLLFH